MKLYTKVDFVLWAAPTINFLNISTGDIAVLHDDKDKRLTVCEALEENVQYLSED